MNASNAFRSNLMQQFASAALKSQRPPLALVNWVQSAAENSEEKPLEHTSRQGSSSHKVPSVTCQSDLISAIASGSLSSLASASTRPVRGGTRFLATFPLASPIDHHDDLASAQSANSNLSQEFQTLLQTRRTGSRLLPRNECLRDSAFWNDALERAVMCAIRAPNHRRTEPVTFKRMIAPSERTCQLSEIAYQTTLKKKLGSLSHGAPEDERIAIQESVAKKRQKWDQIPAFLVTLVASEHKLVSEATTASMDPYEPIAFQPPTSERELEDYATACASVQNCLLSLHAENIASKWVTGEVIATPAFRKLVKAKENDRVVALIMVGEEDEQAKKTHPRRMRRHIHGDVLVDL